MRVGNSGGTDRAAAALAATRRRQADIIARQKPNLGHLADAIDAVVGVSTAVHNVEHPIARLEYGTRWDHDPSHQGVSAGVVFPFGGGGNIFRRMLGKVKRTSVGDALINNRATDVLRPGMRQFGRDQKAREVQVQQDRLDHWHQIARNPAIEIPPALDTGPVAPPPTMRRILPKPSDMGEKLGEFTPWQNRADQLPGGHGVGRDGKLLPMDMEDLRSMFRGLPGGPSTPGEISDRNYAAGEMLTDFNRHYPQGAFDKNYNRLGENPLKKREPSPGDVEKFIQDKAERDMKRLSNNPLKPLSGNLESGAHWEKFNDDWNKAAEELRRRPKDFENEIHWIEDLTRRDKNTNESLGLRKRDHTRPEYMSNFRYKNPTPEEGIPQPLAHRGDSMFPSVHRPDQMEEAVNQLKKGSKEIGGSHWNDKLADDPREVMMRLSMDKDPQATMLRMLAQFMRDYKRLPGRNYG